MILELPEPKNKYGRRYTKKQIDEVRRLYGEGMNRKRIAAIMGMSYSTIFNYTSSLAPTNNPKHKGKKLTKQQLEIRKEEEEIRHYIPREEDTRPAHSDETKSPPVPANPLVEELADNSKNTEAIARNGLKVISHNITLEGGVCIVTLNSQQRRLEIDFAGRATLTCSVAELGVILEDLLNLDALCLDLGLSGDRMGNQNKQED